MEPSWTVPVTADGSRGVNRKWLRGEMTVCGGHAARQGFGQATVPCETETLRTSEYSATHQVIRPVVARDLSCKVLHEGHAAPACEQTLGARKQ